MAPPWVSLGISIIALAVSAVTAWLTFLRKGKLRMTQPTVVYLGPDGPRHDGRNKVYMRTLLYSTAKRGHVLESLYVTVQRAESKQNFSIWVYGDKDTLKRGSGLFVPDQGVVFDHHFLMPEDGANFGFTAGTYRVTVFARLVGMERTLQLMTVNLVISDAHASALGRPNTGLNFDWGPDLRAYHPHIDARPARDISLEQVITAVAKAR